MLLSLELNCLQSTKELLSERTFGWCVPEDIRLAVLLFQVPPLYLYSCVPFPNILILFLAFFFAFLLSFFFSSSINIYSHYVW
jgi:hypothetical protein